MGKQNRQRRAAKQRHRQARQSAAGSPRVAWAGDSHSDPRAVIAELWTRVVSDPPGASHLARARLAELEPVWVAELGESLTLAVLDDVWQRGWQPAEVARHLSRIEMTIPSNARLGLLAIAANHAEVPTDTLDPRWVAQLDVLDLPRVGRRGWLRAHAELHGLAFSAAVFAIAEIMREFAGLRAQPILLPPPGSARAEIDLTSPVDDPILARVRALLAQAESTTFEHEAETFTAKAQELMTRHATDEALLDARAHRAHDPVTMRIPIDDPYADAKALLAQIVAEQTRCRAVSDSFYGRSSIIGLPRDVAATEVLFTSLLVQCATALQAAAVGAPAGDRRRSRSFRTSFWLAYAHRVGERLEEINERLIHDADTESSGALLPVLSQRSARVDAAVETQFPQLKAQAVRGGYDAAGLAGGRAAADRARLNAGAIDANPGR